MGVFSLLLLLSFFLFFLNSLTCPAASEGTSLYVLNDRFAARGGAGPRLKPPLEAMEVETPRCRRTSVADDDAKDDDTDEAEDAKNAVEARDAESVALRVVD